MQTLITRPTTTPLERATRAIAWRADVRLRSTIDAQDIADLSACGHSVPALLSALAALSDGATRTVDGTPKPIAAADILAGQPLDGLSWTLNADRIAAGVESYLAGSMLRRSYLESIRQLAKSSGCR